MDYKKVIREVPDFPKEGILFYDITTLLAQPEALSSLIDEMVAKIKNKSIAKIAGVESRGFIFAAIIANKLNKPFVPIRKPGKLPYKTKKYEYSLEYGKDAVEIHEDAISKGDKVAIIDDLLATGGTINAAAKLIEQCGGEASSLLFAIELEFLHGRDKLRNYNVDAIIKY